MTRNLSHSVFSGLVMAAALGLGCQQRVEPAATEAAAPPQSAKPAIGAWGFDLAGMDKAATAGDDFFRHAVGTWVDRAEIPADLSNWNSMNALAVKAEEDVKGVVEQAQAGKPAKGTVEQKVVDVYASYLDTARINELGLKPFEADLALFQGLKTHEDVAAAIGRPGLPGNTPIGFGPMVDAKDPNRYTVVVTQAGLGLPIRDFYLSQDPAFVQIRRQYRDYVEQMLTLARTPEPGAAATAIAALEMRIAQQHWPLEKVRNKDLTYNPKSRAELQAFAPAFPWACDAREQRPQGPRPLRGA